MQAAGAQPRCHAGTVAKTGAAWRRSVAQQHSGARRSADARHDAPPPMAVEVTRRGPNCNCQQDIVRRASNSSPQGLRCNLGGETSRPRKPKARATGSSQAQHGPKPRRVQRLWLSRLPARLAAREAGSRRDGGAGISADMCGRPARASERPGVQPGKANGVCQPPCGCSFPLFGPRRTRG